MFSIDKRRADGRETICKDCRRAARHARAVEGAKQARRRSIKIPITGVGSELDQSIVTAKDEIDLISEVKKKHDSFFSVSFHPHLDGFSVKLHRPRYYNEGKDLRAMLLEALSLPQDLEPL